MSGSGINERERAWTALRRVESRKVRADRAVSDAVATDVEKGFVTTVVRGATRWRPRLDFLIEKLARRSLGSVDADVATLLRAALYELLEMRSPSYAVVNEYVGIAARRLPRAKGFVNAVLREATRVPLETLVPEGSSLRALAAKTGHPEWLLGRWIEQFGRERAVRIAMADQEPSYPDLLVNTRRTTLEAATALLAEKGIEASASPFGIPMLRLRGSVAPLEDEIAKGMFHPMDEGSWLVAALVPPGGRVLDLTAAPGGKTLAMTLRGSRVVAHDASVSRLFTLRETCARFLDEVPPIVAGDGRHPAFRGKFDAILIDAPCSATGTLRKNPEVRVRLEERDLGGYAERQAAILRAAEPLAALEIVYATCSLEPEENRDVVDAFLREFRDWEIADATPRVPARLRDAVRDGVLVLTPDLGTDGFTATVLRRRS
ncbi:MAG: RsmB/NOP family class I SAM-dependent RNA methyltransferase [Thermoanaerobaculia bacterium]